MIADDGAQRRVTIANVVRALLPLGGLLSMYAAAQLINPEPAGDPRAGVRNLLGFPLHVTEPVAIDRWLFGELPSYGLQAGWRADPSPRWWDGMAGVVYVSHFLVIPVVTIAMWRAGRPLFNRWVAAVLAMTAAGICLYVSTRWLHRGWPANRARLPR